MYLISVTLKFETKILDIAYLLLLKLMKEPKFEVNGKFIGLYVKVLIKQHKYEEALTFIDNQQKFFEDDKSQRQRKEAQLKFAMANLIPCTNVYFAMLRANNNSHAYKDIWPEYQQVIRIVLNDFALAAKYDFNKAHVDAMISEDPSAGTSTTNSNFE